MYGSTRLAPIARSVVSILSALPLNDSQAYWWHSNPSRHTQDLPGYMVALHNLWVLPHNQRTHAKLHNPNLVLFAPAAPERNQELPAPPEQCCGVPEPGPRCPEHKARGSPARGPLLPDLPGQPRH